MSELQINLMIPLIITIICFAVAIILQKKSSRTGHSKQPLLLKGMNNHEV